MTSRDSFGEQLGHLPPALSLGATPEQIMRRGRRIRLIRQGSVAGAAALAVIGIVTTASLAGRHHGTQSVQPGSGNGLKLGGLPAASTVASAAPSPTAAIAPPASSAVPASSAAAIPSGSPAATCAATSQPTAGAPAATNDGNPPAWGTPINVGADSGNSVVLYGFHVDDSAIPCTHFGLMLGTTARAGSVSGVTGMYAANEFSGSDLTPGFHAVGLSGGGNQVAGSYYIGYYVGAAASISVIANGVPVAAHVAPWSVNPDVKIWWIGGAGAVPTYGALSAKDAVGNPLPVGAHAQPGVG
jgi:hypothetical protein